MDIEFIRSVTPVMWVIVGSGLLALIVFIERSLHLHRARIRSDDFVKGMFNIVARDNITEAIAICDETPGPVSYVVKSVILHRDEDTATLRARAADASAAEISRMERRLVVVATVAQIAPLMGLLGTILGLLDSVIVMESQAPMLQSMDVLSGLRGALSTTAAGLMVAIPSYAAFNHLVVRIDRIVLDMDRAASEIIAFIKSGSRRDAPATEGQDG